MSDSSFPERAGAPTLAPRFAVWQSTSNRNNRMNVEDMMKEEKINELLYLARETELGGVHVYQTTPLCVSTRN